MSRVFIGRATESPSGQMIRKTENGQLYHQSADRNREGILDTMVDILVRSILPPLEDIPEAPSDERVKATAKHAARQYLDSWADTGVIDKLFWKIEPVEGYTWSEMVEIVEVDEENGEVTMEDHITRSEWTEPIEEVEEKLETVRSRAHDLMYDIVAGQYFTLDADEVEDLLHDAEGIEEDGTRIENMHIQRIYVADEEQVPDAYDVQEDENGDLYYERDDSEFIDSGRVSQEYEKADDGPCWDGYEMVGMKVDENGNEVPNCVPIDEKAERGYRKTRIYVSDPSQVPYPARIQEGPRGGYYYETDDMPGPGYEGGTMEQAMQMASNQVDVPDQESLEWVADLAVEFGEIGGMPRGEFQGIVEAYNMGKPRSEQLDFEEVDNFVYDYYEQNNPDFKSRRTSKRRVYITDPSEAPDDADVQEGPRGGMYFETDSAGLSDRSVGLKNQLQEEFGSGLKEVAYEAAYDPDGLPRDEYDSAQQFEDDLMEYLWDETGWWDNWGRVQQDDEVYDAANDFLHDIAEPFVNEMELEMQRRSAAIDESGIGDRMYEESRNKRRGGRDFRNAVRPARKSRVYVSNPGEVPDGYEPQQGPRGGWYYEGDDVFRYPYDVDWESIDAQRNSESIEDRLTDSASGFRHRLEYLFGEEEDAMTADRLREIRDRRMGLDGSKMYKDRVYVNDPSEAPQGANIQEGDRGGLYYERGDSFQTDRRFGQYGEASDEELETYADQMWASHAQARESEDDEAMITALNELMHIDREMRSRERDSKSVQNNKRFVHPSQVIAMVKRKRQFAKARRVYITDPSEAPDDSDVQEGPRGGMYYETRYGVGDDPSSDFIDSRDWGQLNQFDAFLNDVEDNVLNTDDEVVINEIQDKFREAFGFDRGVRGFSVENPDAEAIVEVDDWFSDYRDTSDSEIVETIHEVFRNSVSHMDHSGGVDFLDIEGIGKSTNKRRVYVNDPSEAPDDSDVQEGPRGGMYFETNTNPSTGFAIEDQGMISEFDAWAANLHDFVDRGFEHDIIDDVQREFRGYFGGEGADDPSEAAEEFDGWLQNYRDIVNSPEAYNLADSMLEQFRSYTGYYTNAGYPNPTLGRDRMKARVQVDDPTDAPSGVNLHGGMGDDDMYYETDVPGAASADNMELMADRLSDVIDRHPDMPIDAAIEESAYHVAEELVSMTNQDRTELDSIVNDLIQEFDTPEEEESSPVMASADSADRTAVRTARRVARKFRS